MASHPGPGPQSNGVAPMQDLMTVLLSALDRVDNHLSARLSRMEVAYEGLAKALNDTAHVANATRQETKESLNLLHATRQETKDELDCLRATRQETTDGLNRLQATLANVAKSSRADAKRIELLLGTPNFEDEAEPQTVFSRIEQVERSIVELSETISDPDAARPVIVRHEAGVNTTPEPRHLIDTAVDALALESPAQRIDVGVQTHNDEAVAVARPANYVAESSWASRFARLQGLGLRDDRSTFSPFGAQPLGPAEWTPRDGSSESSGSLNKDRSPEASDVPNNECEPVSIPTPSEGHASSIFEEEEILATLKDDMDRTSQTASSPSVQPTPLLPAPALPVHTPVALPHRPVPPFQPEPVATTQIPASLVATSSTLQETSAAANADEAPKKPTPPLPRRSTLLAAASASGYRPAARITLPLPRGLLKGALNDYSATASSSNPSPLVSGSGQPGLTQRAAPSSSSSSMSSLSSLSSPARSQEQPQTRARAAETVTSSPSTDGVGESAIASTAGLSREGSARGRSRSRNRGGKANASASVRVGAKKDRSDDVAAGRDAKRRKTMGDATEQDAGRGGSTASTAASSRRGKTGGRGGRGRARGGGPSMPGRSRKTGTKVDAGKAKAEYEPPRVGTDCLWPEKIEGDEAYRREFIQCDNCEAWYHFGCVGLQIGDTRLEPDAEFICPPCESSDAAREQRQNIRFQEAACVRPDCDRAGLAEETNEYFVERIIGRRPYDADLAAGVKRPERFLWLVKWDGWKAEFASWTEREHLGDCAKLIEDFEQAAEIEGRDVKKLNHVIVLNEGAAVGW
ncbi:hypothetical protein PYCCODRAFT_1468631 [Trametes coccinea BRFM310]|uniref:Chromo domain-containing protein n=1 Tax=Trametes coccinea (strain BRFM310) TaxID=1353009 RepID=A0A1Y2IMI4_TRAC3|nr:hypothetical protein PYCCODRAFT_1468631 [Trametes coccinea BRFM310]